MKKNHWLSYLLSNGEVIKHHKFISVVVIELSVRCLNTGPEDRLPETRNILKKIYDEVTEDIWASAWYFQQCGMCDQQSLRPACAYAQSDQSLSKSLEYSMIVKLLIEHHLKCLSLKGGCRGSSDSTHVKMPHCWKSHALVHIWYE